MAKSSNQKAKLLYLLKILLEHTDESHQLSMGEIIDHLAAYDINAERKSLYTDIELLKQYGYDIVRCKHKNFGYSINQRIFELPELKLLVDSVQSSKFITPQKSSALIKKLENLTSFHMAKELSRQVYNIDKVKTTNETIYDNVDQLHHAIGIGKKIIFKYFDYNTAKQQKLRNNGQPYTVSPYSLIWSNENYYLIAHYPKNEGLTHFRVDRMVDVHLLYERAENLKDVTPKNFSMRKYSKHLFSMYSGELKQVRMECDNSVINAVIDKLGMDVNMHMKSETSVIVSKQISVSPPFFAWVFQFGTKIKILSPEDVREQYLEMIQKTLDAYEEDDDSSACVAN